MNFWYAIWLRVTFWSPNIRSRVQKFPTWHTKARAKWKMLWGIYSAIYGEVNVSVEKCVCWNKGRLCWKTAQLFNFCHLQKLVRPENFGPYYVLLSPPTKYADDAHPAEWKLFHGQPTLKMGEDCNDPSKNSKDVQKPMWSLYSCKANSFKFSSAWTLLQREWMEKIITTDIWKISPVEFRFCGIRRNRNILRIRIGSRAKYN